MDPMAPKAPPQTPRVRSASATGDFSRRTLVLSALALGLVLVLGVAIVALTTDPGPRQDTQGQLREAGGSKPHIIPRPGEGHAPKNPGDPGGWEQLTLFAVMLGGMVGIGVVIFWGGRKARANRAQWIAAGATGRDGVLGEPAPPDFDGGRPGADRTTRTRTPS